MCLAKNKHSLPNTPPPTPKPRPTAEEQAKLDAAAELEKQRVIAWDAHKERIEKQREETYAQCVAKGEERPSNAATALPSWAAARSWHPCDALATPQLKGEGSPSVHQCRDGRPCRSVAECRADVLHEQHWRQTYGMSGHCYDLCHQCKCDKCPSHTMHEAATAAAVRPDVEGEQCWRNLECCLPAKGGAARTKRHADIAWLRRWKSSALRTCDAQTARTTHRSCSTTCARGLDAAQMDTETKYSFGGKTVSPDKNVFECPVGSSQQQCQLPDGDEWQLIDLDGEAVQPPHRSVTPPDRSKRSTWRVTVDVAVQLVHCEVHNKLLGVLPCPSAAIAKIPSVKSFTVHLVDMEPPVFSYKHRQLTAVDAVDGPVPVVRGRACDSAGKYGKDGHNNCLSWDDVKVQLAKATQPEHKET